MSPFARVLVGLISLYRRFVSPLFGAHCRYHPTCSEYALTAIQRFGALKGSRMAVGRIARCHPWAAGGVDHVPERELSLDEPPAPVRRRTA